MPEYQPNQCSQILVKTELLTDNQNYFSLNKADYC